MTQERNERIPGFDALRFCMVVLVIVLHASMTFMEYAPSWWYVLDDQRYLFFTFLVILLDCFPMSVLFFLAGYFSPPSFNKRGFGSFCADKAKRIGLPWLAGVFFAAPFFAYLTCRNMTGRAVAVKDFIPKMFFGVFYQQAHYWFLGVLLFLFLLYALFALKAAPGRAATENQSGRKPADAVIIAAAWFISTAAYYAASLFKSADAWFNAGYVLYFQQARITAYVLVFALGVYAYRKGWYTKNGWTPKWVFWGIVDAVVMGLSVYWTAAGGRFNEPVNRVMNAFWYNTIAVLSTLFFTGLFCGLKKPGRITAWFLPYSYGIYWFHSIVLTVALFVLKPCGIAGAAKWLFSIIATLFICQILCKYAAEFFTRNVPRRIFARRVK
jgi:peptidoglycan/LPS O-acetylase OafA/YrhL